MKRKSLQIDYIEYDSFDELSPEDRKVLEKAVEAADSAYAPHSNFYVGAAILLEDGTMVKGSNQENAAFPSGLCAERTAAFYCNAEYPSKAMKTIAVVAKTKGNLTPTPTYPCGACLQVLVEYENKWGGKLRTIIGSAGKTLVFDSVKALLPFSFDNLE